MRIPLLTPKNETDIVSPRTIRWLVIFVGCVAALGMGVFLSAVELSIGDFVIGVVAISVLMALMSANKKILRGVMYFGLLTFGFGFRELHIEGFRIHPDEVVFWVLAVSLVIGRIILKREVHFGIHWGMLVFFALVTVAVPVGLYNEVATGDVLTRYLIWVTLIPVFFVVENLVENLDHVRTAIWFLIAVAFYVALLGVAEYVLPELFVPFRSSLATDTATQIASGGYVRGAFSVFGNPVAANYLAWLIPPLLFMTLDRPRENMLLRIFGLVTLALCAAAIYISGNRAAWLVSVLVFGLYAILARHWWWLLVLPVPVVLNLFPETFYDHLIGGTLIDPERGNLIRESLWRRGIDLTLNNPFGNGLGMGYLSHNDYIQIAADIGIPALVLFAGMVFVLVRNLWQLGKDADVFSPFARVLLISLVGVGLSILFHPIFEMAALAIPIWFVAALARNVLTLSASVSSRMLTDYPEADSGI